MNFPTRPKARLEYVAPLKGPLKVANVKGYKMETFDYSWKMDGNELIFWGPELSKKHDLGAKMWVLNEQLCLFAPKMYF